MEKQTLLQAVFQMEGETQEIIIAGILELAANGELHLVGVTTESDLIGVNCNDD